ncbi:MAG TPA: N-6 DNA methylase, partial [Pirellulaceae bacterium]|nr:N-6 DNA methylase [Pirellulaceae bacterium]
MSVAIDLGILRPPMGKEQFFYPATPPLFKKLEQLSQRSSVSRGQAFEDFLTATVCALAAETKEDEYIAMIERHKNGKRGRRGADLMPEMFADLVNAMSETDADILGDLFQGSITYGEAGQYFTPEAITKLMAELSVDPDARPTDDQPLYINDPACGTGRMLLEASNINPYAELVGQDIDARCARITAVNLGLRSRYGYVVCGNTLSGETRFAYRIAPFFHESLNGRRRGVIRDIPPECTPVPVIASRLRTDAQGLFEQP